MGSYRVSNPLRLTVLAAKSEDYNHCATTPSTFLKNFFLTLPVGCTMPFVSRNRPQEVLTFSWQSICYVLCTTGQQACWYDFMAQFFQGMNLGIIYEQSMHSSGIKLACKL